MPGLSHEALVQLVRSAPELVVQLLAALGHAMPLHARPRVTAAEFVDLNLPEYRADAVVTLGDAAAPSLAFVVEAQSEPDRRKLQVWPLYATGFGARLGCPTLLVVITLSPEVVAWADRLIDFGGGRGLLWPVVIGPHNIPRITDLAEARRCPELAVLSAAAHGDEPGGEHIAFTAITASLGLDSDRSLFYADFVRAHLGELARKALDQLMRLENYEFQSDWGRQWNEDRRKARKEGREEGRVEGLAEGRVEGLAEGRVEGLAEGLAEGRVEGKAELLLRLLQFRGWTVDAAVRARVEGCRSCELLDEWAGRVLTAASLDEVFAD